MSTIIYGPAGSGKTRNSQILAKFFNCELVIDEASREEALRLCHVFSRALVLTQELTPSGVHIRDALAIMPRGFEHHIAPGWPLPYILARTLVQA